MTSNNDVRTHERDASANIAAALGADVVIPLQDPVAIEPGHLANLAHAFQRRLESSGGRPTDPRWEMTRQVPFALETWDRLGEVADALAAQGRRVARGQIAAMLIEDGLSKMEAAIETNPDVLDAYVDALDAETSDA